MKATLKSLILTILALGVMLSSCDTPAKRLQQARALYEEGTELRQQRLSEEATERFLQANSKTILARCTTNTAFSTMPSRCTAKPSRASAKSTTPPL